MEKTKNQDKKKPGKGKKILLTILGILATLILVLVIIISVNASRNVKAMNACVDAVMEELNENFTLTPMHPGEFDALTLYGFMKFNVEQYDIEDVGNLSVMRVNIGLMQMATFVITPTDKNLPLLSADYMYILSSRKSYLEHYDVVKEKDEQYNSLMNALATVHKEYSDIPNLETSPAWYDHLLTVASYKDTKPDADEKMKEFLVKDIKTYIEYAKQFPLLNAEEKAEKISLTVDYTDGLIEKGGISTDIFKAELGNEVTKKFFDQVFFGTAVQ